MSHKFQIRKKIAELQNQIDKKYWQVETLQKKLYQMKDQEFEKDLQKEDTQVLLKG